MERDFASTVVAPAGIRHLAHWPFVMFSKQARVYMVLEIYPHWLEILTNLKAGIWMD